MSSQISYTLEQISGPNKSYMYTLGCRNTVAIFLYFMVRSNDFSRPVLGYRA